MSRLVVYGGVDFYETTTNADIEFISEEDGMGDIITDVYVGKPILFVKQYDGVFFTNKDDTMTITSSYSGYKFYLGVYSKKSERYLYSGKVHKSLNKRITKVVDLEVLSTKVVAELYRDLCAFVPELDLN